MHGLFGRFADARNACRVAMNLAETAGDPYGRAMSAVWFGTTSYWAGDLDEASKWIDYSRDVMSTTTTGGALHAMADARLAYLQVARGESHRARTTAVQTIEFCVERELYFYLEPWAAHAHACVACGDAHTARAALSELQRLIEQTGQVLYQPFFHERRAEYARAFGGEWNFETEVETACRLFRNLGAEGHAERVSAILSNVSS